jgi:Na+/alanine symporter
LVSPGLVTRLLTHSLVRFGARAGAVVGPIIAVMTLAVSYIHRQPDPKVSDGPVYYLVNGGVWTLLGFVFGVLTGLFFGILGGVVELSLTRISHSLSKG